MQNQMQLFHLYELTFFFLVHKRKLKPKNTNKNAKQHELNHSQMHAARILPRQTF